MTPENQIHVTHNPKEAIMRRLLALVLAIVAITVVMSGTALAGSPMHRATGGGIGGPADLVTYAFSAIQLDTTGNARGESRFLTRVSSRTFQAQVRYLAVDTDTGDACTKQEKSVL